MNTLMCPTQVSTALTWARDRLEQAGADSPWLTVTFGAVLLLTSFGELLGLTERVRFSGPFTWIAGAVSGFLGGLVVALGAQGKNAVKDGGPWVNGSLTRPRAPGRPRSRPGTSGPKSPR